MFSLSRCVSAAFFSQFTARIGVTTTNLPAWAIVRVKYEDVDVQRPCRTGNGVTSCPPTAAGVTGSNTRIRAKAENQHFARNARAKASRNPTPHTAGSFTRCFGCHKMGHTRPNVPGAQVCGIPFTPLVSAAFTGGSRCLDSKILYQSSILRREITAWVGLWVGHRTSSGQKNEGSFVVGSDYCQDSGVSV